MKRVFLFLVALFFLQYFAWGSGFIKNTGQLVDQHGNSNSTVLYVFRTANFQVQLRNKGYSYEYFNSNEQATATRSFEKLAKPAKNDIQRIDIDFVGANDRFSITESDLIQTVNFCISNRAFRTAEFRTITYHGIYPGVDIEFLIDAENNHNFKYNLILHKGANAENIRFLVNGATAVIENETLKLKTISLEITESIPKCYWQQNKTSVNSISFNLDKNSFGFSGVPPLTNDLVIDPVSNLVWGTYQGGSGIEVAMAMDADEQNNLYVTGYTTSNSNIASAGAFQSVFAGSLDIYLAKFNSSGQRLWTSYYGGADVDIGYVITVKPDGTAFIGGATNSSVGVTTSGVHQVNYGGGINDILIVAFDNAGQRLWSSYYGGQAHDIAQAITYDKAGNIIFSGHTESTTNISSNGAYRTVYNFNYDVCLVKFTPTGQRIWGTYYGDSGVDETYGICVDAQNNIYITGGTTSITDIATASAHQQFNGGSNDVFIAKFDTTGSSLIWGTFFGGTLNDAGTAIACLNNTIYVGGNTSSTNNIASPGAQQPTPGSVDDVFLAAFTTGGQRLWSTYFGGEDTDYLNALELNERSEITLTGATNSTANIAYNGPWQQNLATAGYYDAYIARFSGNGNKLFATYYGGEGNDIARGIVLDPLGRVYICGETSSTLAIASTGAFQTTMAGNTDGFLAKFCVPYVPKIIPGTSISICPGSVTLSTNPGYANYSWSNGASSHSIVVSHTSVGSYTYNVNVFDGPDCDGSSQIATVKVNACLGVEEAENLNGLRVFPNPSKGTLWLSAESLEKTIKYDLYDLQGRVLESGICISEINLPEGLQGIYFIKLSQGQYTYWQKILVE